MNKDLLDYLQRLGLNQYQAKALLALFSKNDIDAKEISSISGIPYTKVYEVLNSLELEGLITSTMGKPSTYRPLKPESAFLSLIEKQKTDLKSLEEEGSEKINELTDLQRDGEKYQKKRCNESCTVSKRNMGSN